MLYDAAFRQAVYEAPYAALAGVDLTPEERAAVVRPDPRAFATDPYRRPRALRSLLEEYPVSAWLAATATGDVRTLDAFFSSAFFHDCIQQRGSLAHAFGIYLERGARSGEIQDPRVSWTAVLEGAIAALRRRRLNPRRQLDATPLDAAARLSDTVDTSAKIELSARHALVTVAGGTAHLFQQARLHLANRGRDIVQALLATDAAPAPAGLAHFRIDETEPETLLLERLPGTGSEVTVEAPNPGLAALLALAVAGTSLQALYDEATKHDATPEEAPDIVADLVLDGLLVLSPPEDVSSVDSPSAAED